MGHLKVNKSLFSFGGVIGRVNFLLNYGLVAALMIAFYIGMMQSLSQHFMVMAELNLFAAFVPLIFHYSNCFRRVRDIRGTLDHDFISRCITFIFLLTPWVNILTLIALCVIPGKITRKPK
jgi:uncharacterized membrane protein YhaH (DUF805 family)